MDIALRDVRAIVDSPSLIVLGQTTRQAEGVTGLSFDIQLASVIVHDLHISRTGGRPAEADAKLIAVD